MAIARGNVTTNGAGSGFQVVSNVTPMTFSHTVATASNRILLAACLMCDTAVPTVTATYNGVSMTLLKFATSANGGEDPQVYVFYLIAPTQGANNVVFSFSQSIEWCVGIAVDYNGVDQLNPFDVDAVTQAQTSGSTITKNIITAKGNSWVIDFLTSQRSAGTPGATTQGAGQSKLGQVQTADGTNSAVGYASEEITTLFGTVTMSWSTMTNVADTAQVVLALREVQAARRLIIAS